MTPSIGIFFYYQKKYLNKVVASVWEQQQKLMVQEIRENDRKLSLAGDARCDSMGHRYEINQIYGQYTLRIELLLVNWEKFSEKCTVCSAKYGCYSMLDAATGKVLTLKLIQVCMHMYMGSICECQQVTIYMHVHDTCTCTCMSVLLNYRNTEYFFHRLVVIQMRWKWKGWSAAGKKFWKTGA